MNLIPLILLYPLTPCTFIPGRCHTMLPRGSVLVRFIALGVGVAGVGCIAKQRYDG